MVDDSRTVREGLTALLNSADDMTVVAACADGDEALSAARDAKRIGAESP